MSVFLFLCPRAALVVLTALSVACRAAYLPPATLAHRAPTCGPAPIEPRPGDATPTFFACQVDRPVLPIAGTVLPYPSPMSSSNVEGIVELQFAIDPQGAVDTTTIIVLRSTHELFTTAARQALRGWSWQPAIRRGAAVRQLTASGFCFLLLNEAASTVSPSCELDPRYARPYILKSCENVQAVARMCTDGGCGTPPPPRPRPMNRCP